MLLAITFGVAPRVARSGEPTGREIADLIDELRNQDPHVREVAHQKLVSLGSAPIEALVAAVRGTDTSLGDEALAVLADIGPAAKAAAPKLVEVASSADLERFLAIARVVARIDPPAAQAFVRRLVEISGGPDATVTRKIEVLKTLAALGIAAKDAAPALIAQLGTAKPQLRPYLVEALVKIGADATTYLLDMWRQGSESVPPWVPAILVTVGKPAVDAASQRLKSDDEGRRIGAAAALGAMGPAARDAVPALVFALKDEAGAVRRAAAQALGLIGADAQSALPALSACVADAKLGIQREAIVAIGRIGVAAARPPEVPAPAAARVESGGSSGGATKQTETSVMWALRWLKNHQAPGGQWDAAGFDAQCKLNRCDGPGEATYSPGVTGLALLAFLGAGETHQAGTCRETVKNGLKYLRDVQDTDGCFGPRVSQHFLYNHACAALAMTEAYGMTGSRVFKEPAQRGIGFVLKAKNPYLAWRYSFPPDGDNDTSITGWMVAALKSAQMSELDLEKSALKDAVAWVEKMTDPASGRTGYQQRGGPPARTNKMLSQFPAPKVESLTAIGVLVRIFAGHTPNDDPMIEKGADLIGTKPPKWDADAGTIDFYYWYYASLAMFQVGGDRWKAWNAAMKTAIAGHQRMEADRDERGSWDPVDPWSPEGGRIYATALNCLSMEVYYRYGRVLSPKADSKRRATGEPPVMSTVLRDAVGALTDALKSDDAEIARAAETVLDQLRDAYPPPK